MSVKGQKCLGRLFIISLMGLGRKTRNLGLPMQSGLEDSRLQGTYYREVVVLVVKNLLASEDRCKKLGGEDPLE